MTQLTDAQPAVDLSWKALAYSLYQAINKNIKNIKAV